MVLWNGKDSVTHSHLLCQTCLLFNQKCSFYNVQMIFPASQACRSGLAKHYGNKHLGYSTGAGLCGFWFAFFNFVWLIYRAYVYPLVFPQQAMVPSEKVYTGGFWSKRKWFWIHKTISCITFLQVDKICFDHFQVIDLNSLYDFKSNQSRMVSSEFLCQHNFDFFACEDWKLEITIGQTLNTPLLCAPYLHDYQACVFVFNDEQEWYGFEILSNQ